tara:strand:- start:498 stop:683 length:186 start_codon:yes stop_codon:yes gene_type:complete
MYYKGYRLFKKQGNVLPFAQTGDELAGRGDGTFENGDNGRWEVLIDKPQNDNGVKFLISWA